ncbi:type II secretion system secretin GspD [Desulfococcus multivorans]|uniref:General secretion pathway protein D n=1 Tax=Desulfococcus multivorans DSM 2059 TaxID=1121405 RepID=S7V316_DESML|nr:type II secretion system secretin GspD [Desulfococcus multivorans]AQV00332.1 type II secretion system protein GspD [Desulfococcus multivorans]EPR39048.1 general secretion pathway protein D [Desulfococcus multivorans DSM 2059]SJZ64243.1 general secretion pathway protein D [Desulfococcus multivorans DSM 2059]
MKSYDTLNRRWIRICTISFVLMFLACPMFVFAQSGNENGKERFVSIDFNDVDINVFIKFISELTHRNFIIDRRVKGKVTIISPSKISVKEAYRVFESVLEVHGYTTVESGEITKVIPSPDARTRDIETLFRDDVRSPDDKVVTQLIPLRYADPEDIKRLFAPLVSKSSVILAYQPTNTLIITDVYSNIIRLINILKTIDVVGVGQEISVIPLENADAEKMVRTLSTVFQAQKTARKPSSPDDGAKFVSDERTNSVIILASEDDSVKIRRLISRLDRELPRGSEGIHVYYLEHATAEDLAKTLQSLSDKGGGQKDTGKKDVPLVPETVQITSDKPTNSLIISAEKDEYAVIEDIIKRLDIPRAMVYIEALIMEVDVTKGFGIGTEWIAGGKVGYGSGKDAWVGGGWSGGGDSPYSILGGIAGAAATGAVGLPQGFSMGVFGETIEIGGLTFQNIGAVAQFFRKDTSTHILSTPQLLTTDNEEAFINVGKNVPYQTKTGTTSTSETYNTYEYRDVGITLKVTPQISKDRLIRMKIEQTLTKLDQAANTSSDERPTTFKREVNTTVIVHDTNTIVIGGLIDDTFSESQSKIPCLGDVPGLGWAFKSMNRGREKTNLFIFLTPHVVKNREEAAVILERKQNEVNAADKEGGIKLYNERKTGDYDTVPSIPELLDQP